eukprot:XP_011674755.1 PREDICTED: hepatocyte growth factor-like protein [Strongylocentrotus purpuratus]
MKPGILPQCRYFGFYVSCEVRYCNEHAGCYHNETNGSDYRGLARFTESGYSCINWSEADHEFNETDKSLDANHCRNPDGRERPWCYYYRNQTMETDFCLLPQCTTNVLSGFRRKKDTYPANGMVMTSYYDLGLLVLDIEEKCAQKCIEEAGFECRSFFVGPSGFCLLSAAGAIHDGKDTEEWQNSGGDLFYRQSTRT